VSEEKFELEALFDKLKMIPNIRLVSIKTPVLRMLSLACALTSPTLVRVIKERLVFEVDEFQMKIDKPLKNNVLPGPNLTMLHSIYHFTEYFGVGDSKLIYCLKPLNPGYPLVELRILKRFIHEF